MTEILIVCGALGALVAWMAVDAMINRTKRRQPPRADPMTEYIEALATRPELAGRKDEIPGLARAQLDPWRGFDQPPSDVAGRETPGGGDRFGGIARPASNMIASSRSKGPIGGTRAAEDFGRVCDQMSLKLRRRPPVRRRRP